MTVEDSESWGAEEPEDDTPGEAIMLTPPVPRMPGPYKDKKQKEIARFRRIEDRLLRKNLNILNSIAAAADYDDDEEARRKEVSPEEITAHGSIAAALKHKRIAMDARRPKKFAPVYLEFASAIATSIIKARAVEAKSADPHKAGVANITVHVHQETKGETWDAEYEAIEVDAEEVK